MEEHGMARTGRPREFDRDSALRAALRLFWQQGYEPTSLSQLKEAMGGISPTSFYAAFGSKEQLFNEVVAHYRENEGNVTAVLKDERLSPREAIEACLRQSASMQTDPSHPPGCLIVHGASNCGPDNSVVAAVLKLDRDVNRQAFSEQICRAIRTGALPEDTDTEGLATMFNTLLVGISTAARDGVTSTALAKAIDSAMRVWPASDRPER
jgi:AcrR family transcriptional regulator